MKQYRDIPVEKLALQLAGKKDLDVPYILRQVEGWQRLRHKVPAWAAIDELEYPPRLSLEQCSGEAAARYKARIVKDVLERNPELPRSMADLTGGLGVDFSFLAPLFEDATYVERQEVLCELARHNFPLLGLPQARIVCADGLDYLQSMEEVDLLFLDPARRDGAGRKTVRMADCEPDVCALREALFAKARFVLIKLSPMLDLTDAIRSLEQVVEAHIYSTGNECKDLLLLLDREAPTGSQPRLVAQEGEQTFSFSAEEEANTTPTYVAHPEEFLYEPGPAILKAGAFRCVATRYGLHKMHPHAHLYTSANWVPEFPGRSFRVVDTFTFNKAELRRLRNNLTQVNLTIRNFPATVDALRKKLKLREGGNQYLFATTGASGEHLLILGEKV